MTGMKLHKFTVFSIMLYTQFSKMFEKRLIGGNKNERSIKTIPAYKKSVIIGETNSVQIIPAGLKKPKVFTDTRKVKQFALMEALRLSEIDAGIYFDVAEFITGDKSKIPLKAP